MLRQIRNRLTYANVMSTLAVFIALGGSSYAALQVGTRDIKNNAVRSVDLRNNDVRGKDVRNGTLTGVDVKRNALGPSVIAETRLGKVPSAAGRDADRVGGRSVEELRVRCPAGTVDAMPATCYRDQSRQARCRTSSRATNAPSAAGYFRRYAQLRSYVSSGQFPLAAGGEFTSNVFTISTGGLRVRRV